MSDQLNKNQSRYKKSLIFRKETIKRKKFLLKPVPLYFILLLLIIPVCSMGLYFNHIIQEDDINGYSVISEQHDPNVKVVRNNDISLINPLLFVEIESEKFLIPVKIKINNYMEQKKREGAFTSASVYLKDLNTGLYMNINPDSLYDPASLRKVPLLLIYLKQAETNPDLLKKKYLFTRNSKNTTVEIIKDKSLVEGKYYTVEELLYYMIVYSDNESFWILSNNIDERKFDELDAEFKIPANFDIIHYPKSDKHIIASVNSVAHYFNVLYNASYLNKTMSAYALNLLTKCTFKEGMEKEIESNVIIAHKFGERTISYMDGGRLKNLLTEFHEFGIVYLKNSPYLLGVMTRGNQSNQLQTMVSDISKIVYDELKSN